MPGGCLLTQVAAKARREAGSTTSTMTKAKTTSVTAATTLNAALGAPATPDAVSRMLSTQTPMASQMPHFLSIHNPAAPTRPATPTATANKTTIDATLSPPLGTAFAHNGNARWNSALDSASRTATTVTV